MFNGDFELDPTASAFDWTITNPEGATARISSEIARSGQRSLEIDFDGTTNVSYGHIRQLTAVSTGNYMFRAAIGVEGITTDKGVGFRISDAEDARRLDLKTEPIVGSTDWQMVELRFMVPAETRCLRVSVYRDTSLKFDCKIAGKVWIDTLTLLPQ